MSYAETGPARRLLRNSFDGFGASPGRYPSYTVAVTDPAGGTYQAATREGPTRGLIALALDKMWNASNVSLLAEQPTAVVPLVRRPGVKPEGEAGLAAMVTQYLGDRGMGIVGDPLEDTGAVTIILSRDLGEITSRGGWVFSNPDADKGTWGHASSGMAGNLAIWATLGGIALAAGSIYLLTRAR